MRRAAEIVMDGVDAALKWHLKMMHNLPVNPYPCATSEYKNWRDGWNVVAKRLRSEVRE